MAGNVGEHSSRVEIFMLISKGTAFSTVALMVHAESVIYSHCTKLSTQVVSQSAIGTSLNWSHT